MRPSRVLAAFCCLTMTSCCSAKAFFWLISCRTWGFSCQTPGSFFCLDDLRCDLRTFCKASFDMDMAAEICRKLTIARKSREKAGQAALLLKLSRFGSERM